MIAIGCAPPDEADARTAQRSAQAGPERTQCQVSAVSDGDSFRCGKAERVRLLMIDAPELAQGSAGRDAQRTLAELMPPGTRISIETDVRARDDYQRILGYAYLDDGRMINEEMARSGYVTALVYPPNVKYESRIRAAVADAQKQKRGLWATDFFKCSPRDYRAGKCGGGKPRNQTRRRGQSAGRS
jgi:micrococcal nuclease